MSLEPGLNSTLSRIYSDMICQAIHKSTHIRAYMTQRINGGRDNPFIDTQVHFRQGDCAYVVPNKGTMYYAFFFVLISSAFSHPLLLS